MFIRVVLRGIIMCYSTFSMSNEIGESGKNEKKCVTVADFNTKTVGGSFPKVVLIDGGTFGNTQSLDAAKTLSKIIETSVGRFDISFNPAQGMTLSDALTESCLDSINKSWAGNSMSGLLILFMDGNNQFIKVVEVGKLYDKKYSSLSVIAVANDISIEKRIDLLKDSQATGIHPIHKFLTDEKLNNMLIDWVNKNK